MRKALSSRISIFLSVDADSVLKYYNSHDSAPLYNRQLSQEFQEYLASSVACSKRNSTIRYKIFCKKNADLKFVEPLIKSIRRHYAVKKSIQEMEFKKFKKRNYILLGISFGLVFLVQGLVPWVFGQDHRIHSVLSNSVDVFSWVILWKPIERLIFNWNPFLKKMLLIEKMQNAEVIVIENEHVADIEQSKVA